MFLVSTICEERNLWISGSKITSDGQQRSTSAIFCFALCDRLLALLALELGDGSGPCGRILYGGSLARYFLSRSLMVLHDRKGLQSNHLTFLANHIEYWVLDSAND